MTIQKYLRRKAFPLLGLAECIVCWSQSEDFAIVLRATENVPFVGCWFDLAVFSTSDDLPGQLTVQRAMLLLPPPRTIWLNGVLGLIAASLFQCLQLTVLQLARFTAASR